MSQIENKLNIDQLLGNLSTNDLVGANGISSNGLASLVENIMQVLTVNALILKVCYLGQHKRRNKKKF